MIEVAVLAAFAVGGFLGIAIGVSVGGSVSATELRDAQMEAENWRSKFFIADDCYRRSMGLNESILTHNKELIAEREALV